jgi:hypothetical protein
VTYNWRRDNLGIEVHIHCYGDDCPAVDVEVDAAARAWADAIDEEARSLQD